MKRKNSKYRFIIATIILTAMFIFIFSNFEVYGSNTANNYRIVTVENGDTLWSIVESNCNNYKDIRKAIHDIKEMNNIASANIYPGQKIKIPVKLYK